MERFVDSVLAGLTLEEKLGQLTQNVLSAAMTGPQLPEASAADIRSGRIGSFLGTSGAEVTRSLQRVAMEQSRAKIPLLFAHDVIHGFRTIFPVPLAEAASWDPAAVERAARVAAAEGAANGLHWTFAPMVDIARDPRWGRIVEGSGEDPYLGSAMAAARVRGFQGADSTTGAANKLRDSLTLIATAKHYVAYGAAEGGRDYNIADVPERTLREIYLPPFHAAANAGARSVMAAFNEVDGVPMHANRELINGVLRGEWGWDGILVSDYTGIMELLNHGAAADSAEARAHRAQCRRRRGHGEPILHAHSSPPRSAPDASRWRSSTAPSVVSCVRSTSSGYSRIRIDTAAWHASAPSRWRRRSSPRHVTWHAARSCC